MNLKQEKSKFFRQNHFLGFKNLGEDDIAHLKNQANIWLLEHQFLNTTQKQTLLYVFLNSKFPVLKDDLAYLFWMFSLDPNFKLLEIYYEESNYQNINKRCLVELGFTFLQNLLILEQYYNKLYPTVTDKFTL